MIGREEVTVRSLILFTKETKLFKNTRQEMGTLEKLADRERFCGLRALADLL